MPDDYQQSPRIKKVKRDAIYNYYESPPTPPQKPARPGRWGWIGGGVATLVLAGSLLSTQLSAQKVYYCASRNTVKYHTDATCAGLQQCGARVKSMALGRAKDKMELCKVCR
jgi:hypothetical protein